MSENSFERFPLEGLVPTALTPPVPPSGRRGDPYLEDRLETADDGIVPVALHASRTPQ